MKFAYTLAALCLIFFGCPAVNAQASSPESLRIGRGDLLHITVFRESDLEQHVRVKDSGEVDLDLAGTVKVAGLTASQAAHAIAQQYKDGHYLNYPQVSVLIEEYATQKISVLGQVKNPGAFTLAAPRNLLDVLALAGGLTEVADRKITVLRADKTASATTFLPNDPQAGLKSTLVVYPGDTVLVPKAGIVYVLGDVGHPGGFVMQDDAKMTVLEAVALASGTNRTAKEDSTRLIRKINGNYQDETIPLKDIEQGKHPDMQLEAGDVLYIPFSLAKNVVIATSGIVSSTSSAAIYATR